MCLDTCSGRRVGPLQPGLEPATRFGQAIRIEGISISPRSLRGGDASHVSWVYTGFVRPTPKSLAKSASVSVPAAPKILALDYGRTKIGIALADCQAHIAEPFSTMERINRNEDMRRLREFARDHQVKEIVVGLPLRLDGTPGEMAEEATRFAERLRKQLSLPVELVDERLTSWEAERILEEELGRRITHIETRDGRKRSTRTSADKKYTVDAVAAMVILRDYLARTSIAKESA
jgi:putative holliday junction resolvase